MKSGWRSTCERVLNLEQLGSEKKPTSWDIAISERYHRVQGYRQKIESPGISAPGVAPLYGNPGHLL